MGLFRLSGMGVGVFAAAALVTPAFAQEANLSPKFEKDAASAYTVATKVKQSVDSPMGKQDMTIDQEVGLALKVLEVTEEGATIELTVEGIKFSTNGMMGTETFDSAKPADEDSGMYAPTLRELVGAKMSVSVKADGTFVSVDGLDDVLDDATSPEIAQQVFSEDQVKDTIESIFHAKDDSPTVKQGEVWSKERVEESEMGKITTTVETTVDSISGEEVGMSFKGEATLEEGAGAEMGMKVEMKDSVVKGKGVWSTAVGALKSLDMTQNATMNLTGPMNAAVQIEATRTVTRK